MKAYYLSVLLLAFVAALGTIKKEPGLSNFVLYFVIMVAFLMGIASLMRS